MMTNKPTEKAKEQSGKPKRSDGKLSAPAIAEELSRMIEARKLGPGDHIREQELADHFGTSRGPIREALRILESRFQVEIRPNLGAIVPHLSAEQIVEIHDLRGSILSVAARWAAIRAPESELQEIRHIAEKRMKLAEQGSDANAFVDSGAELRTMLADASHSKRLSSIYRSVGFGVVSSLWMTSWATPAKMRRVAKDWLDCCDALEARDEVKASRTVLKIYRRLSKDLEKASLKQLYGH